VRGGENAIHQRTEHQTEEQPAREGAEGTAQTGGGPRRLSATRERQHDDFKQQPERQCEGSSRKCMVEPPAAFARRGGRKGCTRRTAHERHPQRQGMCKWPHD
jgi:hypothetical protein